MAAIGVIAAVTAVLVLRRPPRDAPASAIRDLSRIASGRLHLEMRSSSPAAVSRFFAERGLPFRVAPATLSLPGFRLSGARVHAIGDRPSALAVHRDARNRIVLCQRFEGRVEELPAPDRVFLRGPVKAHLYRSRRSRAIFWQDGTVVRSFASDVSEDELVRLASER